MVYNDRPIRILVSGASVAGLSTAHWLTRYGFDVTVVEREPFLRPGGQALDVRGPGLEVAARMGILAELEARTTKLSGMSIVDGEGKELSRSTERTLTGGRLDSPDVEVLRDDLCAVLFEGVRSRAHFLFDDRVVALTQDESGVDVTFANGKPQRFDLVVGADGLHSGIRRLAFGPEEEFLRFMGIHIAVFSIPNFLGLDHWEIMCQDGEMNGLMLAAEKAGKARVYLGFGTDAPLDYDYRDIATQKRLISEHYAAGRWEFPTILKYMQESGDFYFYSASQVRMGSWSKGRVVLVGDAGYSVTPSSGQGTTIAMVGAYVLGGELAASKDALVDGIRAHQHALQDYISRNLELALDVADRGPADSEDAAPAESDSLTHSDGTPDFDVLVQPFELDDYTTFLV